MSDLIIARFVLGQADGTAVFSLYSSPLTLYALAMSTLYVVATPIGNLEDITLRALRVFKEVDLIACEDTRRTKILLDHYKIRTPVTSLHEHSGARKFAELVGRLAAGESMAIASDAGTPGINDPGGRFIQFFLEEQAKFGRLAEIPIVPIPGPNAGVTLLSVSGWPADQYLFLGYLPKKKGRATLLKQVAMTNDEFRIPLIIYESPYRLVRTLEDFGKIFPAGEVVVGRELTKKFEEIWRGTLTEAVAVWSKRTIRGELVLLVQQKKSRKDS